MKNYKWQAAYSIGDDKIDNQHKYFFDLINVFIDKFNQNESKLNLFEAIEDIKKYTQFHFTDELKYFSDLGLDQEILSEHAKKHQYFIEELSTILNDNYESDKLFFKSIILFITLWLVEHIFQDDNDLHKMSLARIS